MGFHYRKSYFRIAQRVPPGEEGNALLAEGISSCPRALEVNGAISTQKISMATPIAAIDVEVFQDVFNASPIGIALESLEGQPLFVNPALCKILGFTEEEILRKRCLDFSPADDAERDWALLRQLRAGLINHYQIDKRYFRRDRSLVWGRLTVCLMKARQCSLVLAMVEDVTERKLGESRLQEYENAVEAAEEMIAVVDRDYRYLIANRKYLETRKLTRDRVVGRSVYEVLNEGEADLVKQRLDECFAGKVVRFEIRHSYPDIGERDLSVCYFPIEGANAIDRAVCILQDITERKRAEDAVRESERRFRQVADTAPVMIWTAGTDKRWTYVNKPWLDYTGHSMEEDLGDRWAESIHPDDVQSSLDTYRQCFDRHERFRMEYRLRRHDGEYRWILDMGAPRFTHDGSFAGYIGSAVDVSERKIAEDALHASELRQRMAQQAARMGTFEHNIETGVNTWTPELEAIYGLAPGTFAKTRAAFLELVHPEDRASVETLDAEALKSGQPVRGEWRIIWPDGTVHWIAGRWRVVMDEHGEPLRRLGVNIDITERKQTEKALLQMQRKLSEAQEQERARIGRELHDDINQRLAMVTVEVDNLQRHCPASAAERTKRLDEIRELLIGISKGVQSLSHQLHPSQLEYLGVVSAMRSFCREFAERQMLAIGFKADDIPKPVPKDVSLCLLRVLQEALHNAFKHSQIRHFEVRLECAKGELHLIVSDRGKGFDVESATGKGGLGLISMRERVRLVNGTIFVESKPGVGTTVHVRVPF